MTPTAAAKLLADFGPGKVKRARIRLDYIAQFPPSFDLSRLNDILRLVGEGLESFIDPSGDPVDVEPHAKLSIQEVWPQTKKGRAK